MKKLARILTALSILTLTHCVTNQTGGATGDYNEADVGKMNKVAQGVIVSQRVVNVYNRPTTGTASSDDSATDVTRKTGHEYVIKLDSGSIISVVQTEDLNLEPKQRILVIYGSSTRVVPDQNAD